MKYLNKSLKGFSALAGSVIVIFLGLIISLIYVYIYSPIETYLFLLGVIIMVIIIFTIYLTVEFISLYYIYKTKRCSLLLIRIVKPGMKFIFSFVLSLSGIVKYDKQIIRGFFIEINNIIVNTNHIKYKPEEILILLPHCLQFSECNYKITDKINNCRRCGKCCIGDILNITSRINAHIAIVNGGTAARNLVKKVKPKIILAVACERDLTSGIIDVGTIPVIGLINIRPYGPCYNTCVDVEIFRDKLQKLIN